MASTETPGVSGSGLEWCFRSAWNQGLESRVSGLRPVWDMVGGGRAIVGTGVSGSAGVIIGGWSTLTRWFEYCGPNPGREGDLGGHWCVDGGWETLYDWGMAAWSNWGNTGDNYWLVRVCFICCRWFNYSVECSWGVFSTRISWVR